MNLPTLPEPFEPTGDTLHDALMYGTENVNVLLREYVGTLAGFLKDSAAALEESGQQYVELLNRFIDHVEFERRMIEVVIESGDAARAQVFLPPIEKLTFELKMIEAEIRDDEGDKSADQ